MKQKNINEVDIEIRDALIASLNTDKFSKESFDEVRKQIIEENKKLEDSEKYYVITSEQLQKRFTI